MKAHTGTFGLFLLLGILALGQQVVLAKKFKFKFDSNVTQCQPVSISFRGSEVPANSIPVKLTLLPLSAPPIAVDIPNAAVNASGVYVTFFPLSAGTQFIASLDDEEGDNSAMVSDIFRVHDSDDTSCLPGVLIPAIPLFTIVEPLQQCSDFTVLYNTTTAPDVRLFEPKGKSFMLERRSDDVNMKQATYLMNISRQHDVVLMLDAGHGAHNTTTVILVDGDSSSSEECLPDDHDGHDDDMGDDDQPDAAGAAASTPKGAIIGVSVGGGFIILISILVVLYVLRERRRVHRLASGAHNFKFTPDVEEKRESAESWHMVERNGPSPVSPSTQYPSGYVDNPPYATAKYSPTASNFSRRSRTSWGNNKGLPSSPQDERSPNTIRSASSDLRPVDIEDMLNIAARGGRTDSTSPMAAMALPPLAERLRRDADVPQTPTPSMYASGLRDSSTVSARLSHASWSDASDVLPPEPAAMGPPQENWNSRGANSVGGRSSVVGFPRARIDTSMRDNVSTWGSDRTA